MKGAHAVPDPEPTLLDSNFIKPDKLQLLFRPSGKYAASAHFIQVRVPIKFSQLLLTPDRIFSSTTTPLNNIQKHSELKSSK